MHRFFVSHSSKDRTFVESELIPLLEQWGIDPWYSRFDIQGSQSFHRAIVEGLRSSIGVIVVLSPNAAGSRWVRNEIIWSFAERSGRLVSVLLEDCAPDSLDDLHLEFRELQHVDFRGGAENPAGRLKAAIEKVIGKSSTFEQDEAKPTPMKSGVLAQRKYRFGDLKPGYSPEIERERKLLAESWRAISEQYLRDHNVARLHDERVATIDRLVEDVGNRVTLELGFENVPELSIVARGGFGNGILSSGSDLDISIIHHNQDRLPAERFAKLFFSQLRDIWEAIPHMDISAFSINTVEELKRHWSAVIGSKGGRKLSPLVSFDHTRLLFGDSSLQNKLTESWNEFVKNLSADEFDWIWSELSSRLDEEKLNGQFETFDIKSDAGGILDITITQFCNRWLIAAGQVIGEKTTDRIGANRWKLLRIRECLVAGFRSTGHHLYSEDIEWMLVHPFPLFESDISSTDAALNEINRLRREVRIDLSRALTQLSKIRKGTDNEEN